MIEAGAGGSAAWSGSTVTAASIDEASPAPRDPAQLAKLIVDIATDE
jgi:hypothetical protein